MKRCQYMAHDIQRLGTVAIDIAHDSASGRGPGIKGMMMGPPDNHQLAEIRCGMGRMPDGSCRSFQVQIKDLESGVVIRKWYDVGNEHGLVRQISRDMARAWGCKDLERERGFEGARRRRRRRR